MRAGAESFPLPDDLITPREASRVISCHVSMIYRMVLSGRLRAWTKGGTRYLVSRADARAVLRPVEPRGKG